MNNVDWSNPKAKISKYFTVHEACYLPKWGEYHMPNEQERAEIIKTAHVMDMLRERFNLAITIHCWIRPIIANTNGVHNGQNYNLAVGSTALKSAHIEGKAVDFHFVGYETAEQCQEMRLKIEPLLEPFNIRMEKAYNSGTWIHCDTAPVISSRWFQP